MIVGVLPAAPLVQAASGGADASSRALGDLVSPTAIYHNALSRVCLPLVADAKPLPDVEHDAHLVRAGPGVVHATAADRVYRLPWMSQAFAVAWSEGSCSVTSASGDPAAFRTVFRSHEDDLAACRP